MDMKHSVQGLAHGKHSKSVDPFLFNQLLNLFLAVLGLGC